MSPDLIPTSLESEPGLGHAVLRRPALTTRQARPGRPALAVETRLAGLARDDEKGRPASAVAVPTLQGEATRRRPEGRASPVLPPPRDGTLGDARPATQSPDTVAVQRPAVAKLCRPETCRLPF